MQKALVRSDIAHGENRLPPEGVANVERVIAGAAPLPAIIGIGPQHDRVKPVGGLVSKERIAELRFTVALPEEKTQRVLLRQAMAAEGSSLDPDAAVDLEALFSGRIDQLDGAAALPGPAARTGVRVDSPRAEHLIDVHDDRDRRNGEQIIPDRLSVSPAKTITASLANHIRVHAVIGRGPAPIAREAAGDRRRRILHDNVIGEDVGVGVDIGGRHPLEKSHRPQGGRALDQQGTIVDAAGSRPRLTSIKGVANDRALGFTPDLDLERLGIEAAVNTEARISNETRKAIGLVGLAGRRRLEIAGRKIKDALTCQLGGDEKIVIAGSPVEPVNREYILTSAQQRAMGCNDNVLEDNGP